MHLFGLFQSLFCMSKRQQGRACNVTRVKGVDWLVGEEREWQHDESRLRVLRK